MTALRPTITRNDDSNFRQRNRILATPARPRFGCSPRANARGTERRKALNLPRSFSRNAARVFAIDALASRRSAGGVFCLRGRASRVSIGFAEITPLPAGLPALGHCAEGRGPGASRARRCVVPTRGRRTCPTFKAPLESAPRGQGDAQKHIIGFMSRYAAKCPRFRNPG